MEGCCQQGFECEIHLKWFKLIQFVFSKKFWSNSHAQKCLVGRLILLNKEHPNVPSLGKFRPIRIASNIIKILERYLFSDLMKWCNEELRSQFGFVNKIGPEVARHHVFKTMFRLKNKSKPFWVAQIDLSNAYNSVNLMLLDKLIIR